MQFIDLKAQSNRIDATNFPDSKMHSYLTFEQRQCVAIALMEIVHEKTK